MINYIHRVGRTGRAGTSGKAITFFTDDDKPLLRSLANVLKVSKKYHQNRFQVVKYLNGYSL